MGGLSIWHGIIFVLFSGIWVIPLWRIVGRAGYPGAFALLSIIPVVNLVMLWVFAFSRWPIERNAA